MKKIVKNFNSGYYNSIMDSDIIYIFDKKIFLYEINHTMIQFGDKSIYFPTAM